MRNMRYAGLAAALMLAGAADAAVSTLGGGLARECYLAAEQKRDYRPGIDVCNRALDDERLSRRDRAATIVNRGILHMQASDLDRAIADYRAAIDLQAGLAESHINLGIALLKRGGDDKAAIAALTEGLKHQPAHPEIAYYMRATAYELVGNLRAAYEDYAAAAAARPGWEAPLQELKRFSVQRRKVASG